MATWRTFLAGGHTLPESEDPDYADPYLLLRHILGAAAGYLRWSCEKLGEEEPLVPVLPDTGRPAEVDTWLEELFAAWRKPFRELEEEPFHEPAHLSRWGVPYVVDAMLEHAVMHPMRHRFQLEELMAAAPV